MSYYYANRTMCEHVLLIEDDAIASHEWYEKVNDALNEIEKEQNEKKWLCLKLFTSFRFYDFFTHGPTLVKMFTCDLILTLLQSFVLIKFCRFSPCHSFLLLLLNTFLIHIYGSNVLTQVYTSSHWALTRLPLFFLVSFWRTSPKV